MNDRPELSQTFFSPSKTSAVKPFIYATSNNDTVILWGETLKQTREELGFSVPELSAFWRVPCVTIYLWERSRAHTPLSIQKIRELERRTRFLCAYRVKSLAELSYHPKNEPTP